MDKTLNAVFVSPEGIKNISVPDCLDSFYQTLGCDLIEIISRNINGKPYEIICDEEGRFKDGNAPSILTFHGGEIVEDIVGKILIVGTADDEGELTSLSEDDVKGILSCYIDMGVLNFVKATI